MSEKQKYKKMIFEIPAEWDINKCFTKIENDKIIIDHPVDLTIFERCTSKLLVLDEGDYLIQKLGADTIY